MLTEPGMGQVNRGGLRSVVEFMKISAEQAGVTLTAVTPGPPPTRFSRTRGTTFPNG